MEAKRGARFISIGGVLVQEDTILTVYARAPELVAGSNIKTKDRVVVSLTDGSNFSINFTDFKAAQSAVKEIAKELNVKATLRW